MCQFERLKYGNINRTKIFDFIFNGKQDGGVFFGPNTEKMAPNYLFAIEFVLWSSLY